MSLFFVHRGSKVCLTLSLREKEIDAGDPVSGDEGQEPFLRQITTVIWVVVIAMRTVWKTQRDDNDHDDAGGLKMHEDHV